MQVLDLGFGTTFHFSNLTRSVSVSKRRSFFWRSANDRPRFQAKCSQRATCIFDHPDDLEETPVEVPALEKYEAQVCRFFMKSHCRFAETQMPSAFLFFLTSCCSLKFNMWRGNSTTKAGISHTRSPSKVNQHVEGQRVPLFPHGRA